MYARVTVQQVKSEQREIYRKTWEEQSLAMQTEEPGSASYFFMQDENNENNFVFVAVFKDRAAQQEHLLTPHFKKCKEILARHGIEPVNLVIYEAKNLVPGDEAFWQAKARRSA